MSATHYSDGRRKGFTYGAGTGYEPEPCPGEPSWRPVHAKRAKPAGGPIERAREVLAEFDDGQPYTDSSPPAAAWSDAWQSYRLGQVTEILRLIILEHDLEASDG